MTAKLSWQDSKQAGNDLFKRGEWLKSAAQYSAAIKAFDGAPEDLAVLHRCGRPRTSCLRAPRPPTCRALASGSSASEYLMPK